jgi:LacI family transcriptional regulator
MDHGDTPSPATIMEVAARAGVSRSTVSRVVNGSESVSPHALAAVQQAIADLNYVPNRAARSLASRQTMAIGLIVPEDTNRFFGDPFFAAIVSGIHTRLLRSDYVLNLFIASDDPGTDTGRKLASYIGGGNIDGAIIVSHHTSDRFVDRIAASVPVVYGGRPIQWSPEHYFVDADNVAGARCATDYLIGLGRRRIATITGLITMPASIDRLQGFRAAMAAAGLTPAGTADGRFTAGGGADAMRALLDGDTVPDAVFVASDLMARGVLEVLAVAGVRVPDDIAIVVFDDSAVATAVTPALTTVRQPSFEQGQAIAEVLLQRLSGAEPQHATILPTELVIRESA